ncbi:BlaI/MecI/CopY family transcriptional regulator [Candidatus Parcubacteria bacterium]|jgi:predicted transcriptional regulator|nr:MAG: BlaI/MecI/CopY family transcriptional regulator [Candidatus Parcubacteria bacterium]
MSRKSLPGLGELESAILETIWQKSPITVRGVLDRLNRHCAYTTVMTVMQRMSDKGILRRRLKNNTYFYEAALPKEKFVKQTVAKTFNQLLEGYGDLALAKFLDALDEVDPKRLALLRKKFHNPITKP